MEASAAENATKSVLAMGIAMKRLSAILNLEQFVLGVVEIEGCCSWAIGSKKRNRKTKI